MRYVTDEELYHYGVPKRSGRYKWGSGKNPYHHGDSLPKKIKNKLTGASKKAANVRGPKKPSDEERKKIVASGDAKKVLKYKKYLTTQELKDANNRITQEKTLGKSAKEQEKTASGKAQKAVDKFNDVAVTAEKAADSYDKFAKIINSVSDANLPRIDGKAPVKPKADDKKDDNDKKDDSEKKDQTPPISLKIPNESLAYYTNGHYQHAVNETLEMYSHRSASGKSYRSSVNKGKQKTHEKGGKMEQILNEEYTPPNDALNYYSSSSKKRKNG